MLTVSEAGKKGGRARARNLSVDRLREIASMGGQATAQKRQLAGKQKSGQLKSKRRNKGK